MLRHQPSQGRNTDTLWMMSTRKFVGLILWLPLVLLVGCEKKKTSLPPKTLAPTVAVVLPDELPLTEAPEEPSAPAVEPAPAAPAAKAKPKKPARSSTTHAKKSAPPPTAPATPPASSTQAVASLRPPKDAVPETAPPSSALAAAIPSAQVMQQKEDTTRMVDATENALKGITRTLSDEEKSMRSQIQSYLQQSRKATTEGDFERAYNLAKKAQLLADALVKK